MRKVKKPKVNTFTLSTALETTLVIVGGFTNLGGVLPLLGSHPAQLGVIYGGVHVIDMIVESIPWPNRDKPTREKPNPTNRPQAVREDKQTRDPQPPSP